MAALTGQLELAPKPGLPDPRDLGAGAGGRDLRARRWSAKALVPGLAAMAAAARRAGEPTRGLREELGAIGRCTEHSVALTAFGYPKEGAAAGHRGALWVLGLLVAAAALESGVSPRELPATAKRIAAHPDRKAPRVPSQGSTVSAKFGAAGARGEARAGFPHVRRAWEALDTARRAGTPEPYARLDALLTVMSTLQDTGLLHQAGPHGLRHVQAGARGILEAGGTSTDAGRQALKEFDDDLHARAWRPRGGGALLTGVLFLDSLSLPVTAGPLKTAAWGARQNIVLPRSAISP